MPIYKCSLCDYIASQKSHIDKHYVTKTHIRNKEIYDTFGVNYVEDDNYDDNSVSGKSYNMFKCDMCDKFFSSLYNRNRHTSKCYNDMKKTLTIVQDESNKKDILLEKKDKLIKQKDMLLKAKDKTIDTFKSTSKNTLEFLRKHLPNAPALTEIDTSVLKYNKQTENKDFVFYANKLKEKMLHIYVGDIIVKHYVMANPYDQSIWNLTEDRKNFAIKQKNNQHVSVWKKNGKGDKDKLMTQMINPVVNTLNETIKTMKGSLMTQSSGAIPRTFIGDFGSCFNEMCDISNYIKTNNFKEDIIRYIKNFFLFNYDDIKDQLKIDD